MIKINNLHKSYTLANKSAVQVLNGVNLELSLGETLAITGVSGCGKTTFLSLIAGLDNISSGEIRINDTVVNEMSETQLTDFRAKKLGFIFQNFYLLPHLSVLENVCLPLDIQGNDDAVLYAKVMIEKVGLSHRMHHLPNKLSGGECQRVAIARAIVGKPALILADEPTGNLDINTGQKISKTLFSLVAEEKATMILVTHNPDLAKQCNRHMHLIKGKLQ